MRTPFLLTVFYFIAFNMANGSASPIWPKLPLSDLRPKYADQDGGSRIVGGEVVEPNSIPFMVSIQDCSFLGMCYHICGGSIYKEDIIITSASCVYGTNPDLTRVVTGRHSLTNNTGVEQYRFPKQYIIHPRYDIFSGENDIALLVMEYTFNISVPSAQPVNLPQQDEQTDEGILLTISGWGATQNGGATSDLLRSAQVPVVSDTACQNAYSEGTNVIISPPAMICAGYLDGSVDKCSSDSGGPLFRENFDGSFTQIGVASKAGLRCGTLGYPGVYTEVSNFVDWIISNVPAQK